jgi:hypothetical protein
MFVLYATCNVILKLSVPYSAYNDIQSNENHSDSILIYKYCFFFFGEIAQIWIVARSIREAPTY